MTTGSAERQTKNARRDAAREKARVAREEARKKQRRNRLFLQLSIGIGILVVAALVVWVVFATQRGPAPIPANMQSDGIVMTADGAVASDAREPGTAPIETPAGDDTDGVVEVVTYVDYMCPYCGQFENTFGAQLESLVDSGDITLEVHPIAILDRLALGSQYSSRAAGAAGCVADLAPDDFLAFNLAMFTDQPAENTEGRSNSEIADIATASVTSNQQEIAQCINDETYQTWAQTATEYAGSNAALINAEGNFTTPTVLVNGQLIEWPSVMDEITAAISTESGNAAGTDDGAEEESGNGGSNGGGNNNGGGGNNNGGGNGGN